MILSVSHLTRYRYGAPVRDSLNETRLKPWNDRRQNVLHFNLEVEPRVPVLQYVDAYGNTFHQFEVSRLHDELSVKSGSRVETVDSPYLPSVAATVPLGQPLPRPVPEGFFDFLGPSPLVPLEPGFRTEAMGLRAPDKDSWQTAQAIMHHVHETMTYTPRATTVHTPAPDVAKTRIGVCQDYAHLTLGLLRSVGLAARYVSGYLYSGPRDALRGAQASHAWVEVFIHGFGWVGMDPTNNHLVAGNHIKIAHGRDYRDVPPVKGTYRGTGDRVLTVEVAVELDQEAFAAST